jgi:hypothetical protein
MRNNGGGKMANVRLWSWTVVIEVLYFLNFAAILIKTDFRFRSLHSNYVYNKVRSCRIAMCCKHKKHREINLFALSFYGLLAQLARFHHYTGAVKVRSFQLFQSFRSLQVSGRYSFPVATAFRSLQLSGRYSFPVATAFRSFWLSGCPNRFCFPVIPISPVIPGQ